MPASSKASMVVRAMLARRLRSNNPRDRYTKVVTIRS
jgi:hypothetical protein